MLGVSIANKVELIENEKEFLLSLMEPIHFKKNELILGEGEQESYLYFVEEGITRFWLSNGEKEVTYFFAFPGEFATSFESFRKRIPSTINHQCVTDVKLWRISVNDFNESVIAHPQLNSLIVEVLEKYLIEILNRERDLLSNKPAEYYQKLFTEKPEYIHKVPMKYLAPYLGITPEALSRIRKRLN